MKVRKERLGVLVRGGQIAVRQGDFDAEGRRGEFSFSSEAPVERFSFRFGDFLEILDHEPGSVRLERLQNGGAWLLEHDRDQQIGVVESAAIRNRRGFVEARFSKNPRAEEERVDVVDGIRRNVSFAYLVHKMILDEEVDDGPDRYRVTDWEPLEVSDVSVPADGSVGHGRTLEEYPELAARAAEFANHETTIEDRRAPPPSPRQERTTMRINVERLADGASIFIERSELEAHPELYREIPVQAAPPAPTPAPTPTPTDARVQVGRSADDEAVLRETAIREGERERVSQITQLAGRYGCPSEMRDAAISGGTTFSEFRMELFDGGYTPNGQHAAGTRTYPSLEDPAGLLGLSREELGNYSLLRAIRSVAYQDPGVAPFERECSGSIAEQVGIDARGIYVPADMLYTPNLGGMPGGGQSDGWRTVVAAMMRDVSTTTQGGGNLVATNLLSGSFIDVLRNLSITLSLGATFLPGLVGNVDIPRQSAAGAASWVGEGGSAVDADLTLDVVQLLPKTLTAKSLITRRLMLQSTPAIEGLVRMDLATAIALGIDLAAVSGSGVGDVPEGILNMAGVAVVPLGVNGAVPTWQSQVNLVSEVKKANAFQGGLGFATTSDAWGKLMSTPRESGDAKMILEEPGDRLIGRRLISSEQLPSNLTKGSGTALSAEIFGNWLDLLIGEWGVMDLFPDPFTDGDQGGTIVRVFQDADVAARHEESFSIINDMITV